MYRLFSRPKVNHISKKLLFYIAALKQLVRQDWLDIEKEMQKEIDKLEADSTETDTHEQVPQRDNLLV